MHIPENPDVPIIVETLSRPYFPMHRCHYLYVECDEPRPGWEFRVGPLSMSFLMLGLLGVIQVPFGAPRFEQYQHLSQMFEFLEDQMGMTINFADIWLPDFMFRSQRGHVGDVYRLTVEMFRNALLFRDGRASADLFVSQAEGFGDSLYFSELETRVFLAWSRENVSAALNQPAKNPELRLRTRLNTQES